MSNSILKADDFTFIASTEAFADVENSTGEFEILLPEHKQTTSVAQNIIGRNAESAVNQGLNIVNKLAAGVVSSWFTSLIAPIKSTIKTIKTVAPTEIVKEMDNIGEKLIVNSEKFIKAAIQDTNYSVKFSIESGVKTAGQYLGGLVYDQKSTIAAYAPAFAQNYVEKSIEGLACMIADGGANIVANVFIGTADLVAGNAEALVDSIGQLVHLD